MNGVFSAFDELDVTASTNPADPDELQFVSARYTRIVNDAGTQIAAFGSYSATRPGSFLADREIFGESSRAGIRINHPIRRSRAFSLWAEGSLEYRSLQQDRLGERVRSDDQTVARIGLYGVRNWDSGRLRGRMEVSRGLDIFGATQADDPFASRGDAPADFTSVSTWFEFQQKLFSDFSTAFAGRGQISSDPLLISEDIGLGGPRFVRGYNFSERTGDEGVMGSGELRYDWEEALGLVRRMQFYGYADGGVVSNINGGRSGGSLASAGGGIRTDVTRDLDLDVELAIPLTGPRFDTADQSPRLNIAISHAF